MNIQKYTVMRNKMIVDHTQCIYETCVHRMIGSTRVVTEQVSIGTTPI